MNTECNHCNPGTTHAPEYNTAGNCETPPTQLTTVTIRKDQGGDAPTDPYAPVLGAWRNTIVYYQKNGAVYLYDVNGVYTNLTGTDWGPQIAEALETAQAANTNASQTADALSAAQAQWTARFNTVTGELTSLQSALTAETTARQQGDQSLSEQLSSLTTQVNEIGADVTEQGTTLTEAVSDLQTNINAEANARTESDAALQENVNANTNAIANLEAAIGSEAGGFTKEIMLDLSAAAGASTVTLTKTTGNLGTTVTTDTEIALPTASATQAGILSAADYEKFSAGGSSESVHLAVRHTGPFVLPYINTTIDTGTITVPEAGTYLVLFNGVFNGGSVDQESFSSSVAPSVRCRAKSFVSAIGNVSGANMPLTVVSVGGGFQLQRVEGFMVLTLASDKLTFTPTWDYQAFDKTGTPVDLSITLTEANYTVIKLY